MPAHEIVAQVRLRDAARAIGFYQHAFGARALFRLVEPGSRIGHEIEADAP